MHGVKITFFTQQAGRAKDSAIAHGQRDTPEPSSQSPEHDTPPLNSRRRRSRRRAQAYYANKATSRAGTTGAMQIVEEGDNARSTSGAAQAIATPPGVFVFGAGSPPLGTAACTFDGAGTERATAPNVAAPRVDAGTSGGDRRSRSRRLEMSGHNDGRARCVFRFFGLFPCRPPELHRRAGARRSPSMQHIPISPLSSRTAP